MARPKAGEDANGYRASAAPASEGSAQAAGEDRGEAGREDGRPEEEGGSEETTPKK